MTGSERTSPLFDAADSADDAAGTLDAIGAYLVTVVWDGGSTRSVLRPGGDVVVGRADDVALVVDDGSVSRNHARIAAAADGALTIEDLGSTNGVRVRDVRLPPRHAVAFRAGDAILVGAASVIVRAPSNAPMRGPAPSIDDDAADLDALVARVAPSEICALILGETGVGKNVVAGRIHALSRRTSKPFLRLNCAAFPESLLEAELFGYERGAFTGAVRTKPGLIESADGGTVFLDEIGEMPLTTQAKLLGVLDARETQRLGSLKPTRVDVRFVAATNRDLDREVKDGRFRRDLFFRLSAITLRVPSLRERRREIPLLVHEILADLAESAGSDPVIDADALALLVAHPWPGNIRQLRNALERALVLGGTKLSARHFQLGDVDAPGSVGPNSQGEDLPAEVALLERERILQALDACSGNQTRAAERLGISRRKLIYRMEAFGLPRPRRT